MARTASSNTNGGTTRGRIDRNTVVQAAAQLADQCGSVDQVTLAQLADHFQIRVPSLYNHIEGLDALRREVALLSLLELTAMLRQSAVGKAGNVALVALAQAYRRFAQQYPGRYSATQRVYDAQDQALIAASQALIDLLLVVLEPFNLETDDALHVIRALRSITHGFVTLEASGGFGMALDTDESYRRLVQMFVDGLATQRK
jgi:AcrR family transcriptional regulator